MDSEQFDQTKCGLIFNVTPGKQVWDPFLSSSNKDFMTSFERENLSNQIYISAGVERISLGFGSAQKRASKHSLGLNFRHFLPEGNTVHALHTVHRRYFFIMF